MNVIRQAKNPGARPHVMGPPKPRGRGRGALDFDLIQYRPGQRARISSSSSDDTRTPTNLQLQMAISSSAYRTSSSSIRTESGNNMRTPAASAYGHNQQQKPNHARFSSDGPTSSSSITPRCTAMLPPKTPRFNSATPKNSMIVSSTPRTTPSTSSGADQNNSHVVLAVTEGRGHARGEVGIAVIDVKRPRLILCQLSDRQTYTNALTKISVFRPVEILIPHTFVESNQPNKLYNLLEEKFPFVSMTKVQRRLFRDSEGLEKVQHLCLPENSSCQLILQDRFYALAAAAALLKYIEFVQNVIFAAHSLKVEYQGAHHGTIIDLKTAKNLELLLNQQSNSAAHTLVEIMDHCCTHGGSRLLRASLLHPPCSLPSITKRQDGVQELVENPEVAQKIREVLKQMPDVEQLLTLCMQTPSTVDSTQSMETRINYVIMLKTALETLPLLATALENSQSFLLTKAVECLKDPRGNEMKDRILETIHEDIKAPTAGKTAIFQRCFAIKNGLNDLMDVSRKTYCELISDIHDHVLDLGTTHSLPLKMNYSVTKGYHIQITFQKGHPIKKSDLPACLVQVQQCKNSLSCTTDTLIHANERIKQVTIDILTMSNTLLAVILNDIRQHISYLYEMCESIAEVDLILALAQISSSHYYVRPTFGESLSLKASRHPILESITTCDPIANDIEASSWKNLSIITGPNMSGKSIYIRQVLLLQIMAQVGSYVPAEQATFRITDRIFSHLNFDDSIENNASTLALEMQEMQLILSSITATSLIALDELCRGTSVEEGTAIAWALCEELSQSSAFVFVTTHFRELTRLASLYPSIQNVHLETVEHEFSDKKSRLVYTHRLLPGINPMEHYGLRLAENLNVPEDVLQLAKSCSQQIRRTTEMNLTSAQGNETYTMALQLHKLKALLDKEDVSVDDLRSAQLELKQALEVAQQLKKTALTKQKSPAPLPAACVESHQRGFNQEQRKICEYSSSDVESSHSSTASETSSRRLKTTKLSKDSSFLKGNCSPGNRIFDFSGPHCSPSSASMSSRISSFEESVLVDNNLNSISKSTVKNVSFNNRGGPTDSFSSYCSSDTWLAATPVNRSSQINQRNQSPSPSPSRYRKETFEQFSDSVGPQVTGVTEESFCRHESSFIEDPELSFDEDPSHLSNVNISVDETLDEYSMFEDGAGGKSLLEVSVLSPGPNANANRFFQANTQVNKSSVSNPFSLQLNHPSSGEQIFGAFFKNDQTVKPPSQVIQTSQESSTGFGKKRSNDFDDNLDSPILGSNPCKRPTQIRKRFSNSSSEAHRESLTEQKAEEGTLEKHPQALTESPTNSLSLEKTAGEEINSANNSQVPFVKIGAHRNSLQILMESYCCSDSESD